MKTNTLKVNKISLNVITLDVIMHTSIRKLYLKFENESKT